MNRAIQKLANDLKARRPASLIVLGQVIVIVGGAAFARHKLQDDKSTVEVAGAVLSPDKKMAALISEDRGKPRLWIINLTNYTKEEIGRLGDDEGAANPLWSPDSQFIAFESDNLQGHSPMTTNHVWVANANGTSLRELHLPPPNEHFSTYIDK